jgi:hypothetical protein
VLSNFSNYNRRHCKNIIDGHSSTQFTTPQVQQATQAVLAELKKYERNLCSDLSSLALVLDPPNGNGSFFASHLKEPIRDLLIVEYYYSIEPEIEEMEGNEFDLFMACREVQGDAAVPSDEVDKYVKINKGDEH